MTITNTIGHAESSGGVEWSEVKWHTTDKAGMTGGSAFRWTGQAFRSASQQTDDNVEDNVYSMWRAFIGTLKCERT